MDIFNMTFSKPVINEQPRQQSYLKKPEPYPTAVWRLMRRQAEERERQGGKLDKAIAGLAPALFDLRRLAFASRGDGSEAGRRLELLWLSCQKALGARGFILEALDGRDWEQVAEGDAELLEYLPDPQATCQTVRETVTPLLKHNGRVILASRVIVCGPPRESL